MSNWQHPWLEDGTLKDEHSHILVIAQQKDIMISASFKDVVGGEGGDYPLLSMAGFYPLFFYLFPFREYQILPHSLIPFFFRIILSFIFKCLLL